MHDGGQPLIAELPDLPDAHDLHRVVAGSLRARGGVAPSSGSVPPAYFWRAEHFGLDQVYLFQTATFEEQSSILHLCSQGLLGEAYYIEKSGMYFAARMNLLAESTEERMLYALFAADEAIHFSWIAPYVSAEEKNRAQSGSFISELGKIISAEDKLTCAYLIQVVLEGWGIKHYRDLSKGCLDDDLRGILLNVVKDEARHHGSGLVAVNQRRMSSFELKHVVEILARIFRAVQMGPQLVVSALERVKGHLSVAQRECAFSELRSESVTASKIEVLKSLVLSTREGAAILDRLEYYGATTPFAPAECAAGGRRE